MISRSYKFKFYLNAKHFLYIDGKKTLVHPHTWELTFYFVKESVQFVQFHDLEKVVNNYLSKYESKIINEIEPFTKIVPTMEAIGEVIYFEIFKAIQNYEFSLLKLEISENASRTYIIKNDRPNFRGFNPIKENNQVLKPASMELEKAMETEKAMEPEKSEVQIEAQENLREKSDEKTEEKPVERRLERRKEDIVANKLEELNKRIIKLTNKIDAQEKKTIISEEELIEKDIKESIEVREEVREEIPEETPEEVNSEIEAENIPLNDTLPSTHTTETYSDNPSSDTIIPVENEILNPKIKNKNRKDIFEMGIAFAILTLSYLIIFSYVYRNGYSPWGSDTWGHLFKSHFLYKEFIDGNVFPLYTKFWYNGIQPFRYWGPLTYYVLLIGELISKGNTVFSLYLFNALVFFAGAIPWIMYGKKKDKIILGTILGVAWFIIPDNYRVLFAEGNLPRVLVTTLFPYLLMSIFNFLDSKKRVNLMWIFALMFLMTITHAMIAAIVGITIFVFLFVYSFSGKKYMESLNILISALLGIVTAGIWLFPALQGGIVSLNSSTNLVVMERLTYNIGQSLNPFFRLGSSLSDSYYFGLFAVIISIFGIIVTKGRTKSSFLMVIIIFLGTTKWFLFIIKKLPLSDLFWMMRFTPFAMAFLFIAILSIKKMKKKYMAILISLILIEGIFTMSIVETMESVHKSFSTISYAVDMATQRVGLMDLSTFDSYPSYFTSFSEEDREISQVFGWAWQGATTAPNLVWLNYAFEKGYYEFVFDRSLEMGADTLVFRKTYVEDSERLKSAAVKLGYKLMNTNDETYIFKYPVDTEFGTKVNYEALGIGEYSSNLTYAFPKIQVGNSISLDDYSVDELKKYKKIILSGFEYSDQEKAESKIKELSDAGIEIFIDLTHLKVNMLSQRAEFLEVIAQPINLKYTLPEITYDNKEYVFSDFNIDEANWNTSYLVNLDEILGETEIEDRLIPYYGWKYNENIKFVGLNLFYYAYSKRDVEVLALLEELIGMDAETLPEREILPVIKKKIGNEIHINATAGTLSDLAYLDSFKTNQSVNRVHNLMYLVEGNTNLTIYYPYIEKGAIISCIGFLLFILYMGLYERLNKLFYRYLENRIEGEEHVQN